jgi:hypothetical protein
MVFSLFVVDVVDTDIRDSSDVGRDLDGTMPYIPSSADAYDAVKSITPPRAKSPEWASANAVVRLSERKKEWHTN